eukprot:TRINITY_DN1071_c2_g1_i1.p1 TRINITY_DN1071_c2_g1~~TRINITY_DN1071_c2_g1_i1.p1  ORF type:complete len:1112 (+),score=448.60 TRINITY_DN1071_c2_g1_i1:113-3448(+)
MTSKEEKGTNVQVVCRIRPEINIEKKRDEKSSTKNLCPLKVASDSVLEMPDYTETKFIFDHVLPTTSSQQEVFEATAKPMVKSILEGFNCTIFAYGQTGSGKTFTMMGKMDDTNKTDSFKSDSRGIIPRLVEQVFDGIENCDDADTEFTVKVSFVEIYMERIRDLLEPSHSNLKLREGNNGVWIEDVTELYVGSIGEVIDVMAQGQDNRAIASTRMNEESSRSHSVFIVTVSQTNSATGSKKSSKLFLVDLAGSEKVAKTEAAGQTLEEAKHINKSLSALGNVINSLVENQSHIPYRDSKLTRLLCDALGGNSKTCLIITCSPSAYNGEESLSTLRFGTRAKKIKNIPKVNQEKSVAEYKLLLTAATKQIARQDEIIKALEKDIAELRNSINAVQSSGQSIPILKGSSASLSSSSTSSSTSASPSSLSPSPSLSALSSSSAISITSSNQKDQTPKEKKEEKQSSSSSSVSSSSSSSCSTSSATSFPFAQPQSIMKMQKELDALEKRNTELTDLVDSQREKISEKDAELENVNSKLVRKEDEIKLFKTQVESLEKKVEAAADTMSDLSLAQKKLTLMETEYSLKINELSSELTQSKEKMVKIQAERERERKEREETEKERDEKEKEREEKEREREREWEREREQERERQKEREQEREREKEKERERLQREKEEKDREEKRKRREEEEKKQKDDQLLLRLKQKESVYTSSASISTLMSGVSVSSVSSSASTSAASSSILSSSSSSVSASVSSIPATPSVPSLSLFSSSSSFFIGSSSSSTTSSSSSTSSNVSSPATSFNSSVLFSPQAQRLNTPPLPASFSATYSVPSSAILTPPSSSTHTQTQQTRSPTVLPPLPEIKYSSSSATASSTSSTPSLCSSTAVSAYSSPTSQKILVGIQSEPVSPLAALNEQLNGLNERLKEDLAKKVSQYVAVAMAYEELQADMNALHTDPLCFTALVQEWKEKEVKEKEEIAKAKKASSSKKGKESRSAATSPSSISTVSLNSTLSGSVLGALSSAQGENEKLKKQLSNMEVLLKARNQLINEQDSTLKEKDAKHRQALETLRGDKSKLEQQLTQTQTMLDSLLKQSNSRTSTAEKPRIVIPLRARKNTMHG